jgi:hypothetical protein
MPARNNEAHWSAEPCPPNMLRVHAHRDPLHFVASNHRRRADRACRARRCPAGIGLNGLVDSVVPPSGAANPGNMDKVYLDTGLTCLHAALLYNI